MKNTATAGFNPHYPTSIAPDFSREDKGAKGWIWVLLILAFLACREAVERDATLLGTWQGTDWIINGERSGIDATQVEFAFAPEGTYMARFGDQAEKGTWYTRGDKLYTTAEGRKEIMVKVLKGEEGRISLEMNRGGRPETIELKKQ